MQQLTNVFSSKFLSQKMQDGRLFLFDLIREPHWKFCGSTTRDSAHAQNGECGYAGSSQSPKRLKKAKTPRKLWKERDVTLAPRNVECDDIRIFPARWPTKVLPQFPLWSVLKDFLSKLKFQTWLIFSRWKADVIYTTSSVPMLRLLILSILFRQFSGLLVGWPIWFGNVWFGVVWFGMVWFGMVGRVWYGMVGRWANMATITRG